MEKRVTLNTDVRELDLDELESLVDEITELRATAAEYYQLKYQQANQTTA